MSWKYAWMGFAIGSEKKKVVPAPNRLSTHGFPPWASTSPFTMLRPKPIPERLLRWACQNRSKMANISTTALGLSDMRIWLRLV